MQLNIRTQFNIFDFIAMEEISILNLYKFYDSKKTAALNGIDFYAKSGEITGILGANGAGKSTLLKIISGVQYASSGKILVCGEEETDKIRSFCAYVPENPSLNKNLSVKETLFFEAALSCAKKKEILENINRAVEISDLSEVLEKKVSSLSKGFLQRTSLAVAICKNPKILILDEFSAGLDPRQTIKIRKQIKNFAKDRIVIFSTHHLDEAAALCSSLYILNHGKVSVKGSAAEILREADSSTLEEAYVKFTS